MGSCRRTKPVVRNRSRRSAGTDLNGAHSEKIGSRGGALDFKLGGGRSGADAEVAVGIKRHSLNSIGGKTKLISASSKQTRVNIIRKSIAGNGSSTITHI